MKEISRAIITFVMIAIFHPDFRGQLVGIYTIDNSLPSTTSNFTSFTALATELNAQGVSGSMTVSVLGGPVYSEQVTFNQIAGTSSVNTVQFEGNGRTVMFAGNSAQPWTIGLNGTDFFSFRNLTVTGSGSVALTFHAYNGANRNKIENCHFNCSQTTSVTNCV